MCPPKKHLRKQQSATDGTKLDLSIGPQGLAALIQGQIYNPLKGDEQKKGPNVTLFGVFYAFMVSGGFAPGGKPYKKGMIWGYHYFWTPI